MASNALKKFLAAATADSIRCTNQFEITASSGYNDIDTVLADTMIFGQSFTIPSRSIEFASVSFKGYEVPNLVPTKIDMTKEVTMTVIDDVDGTNRRVFEAWLNKVMNFDINGGSYFEGDRGVNEKSFVRLQLFGKDNETVTQVYKFYYVQVKQVGETSLNYDGGDKSTFDVTFVCSFWEHEQNLNGKLTELK